MSGWGHVPNRPARVPYVPPETVEVTITANIPKTIVDKLGMEDTVIELKGQMEDVGVEYLEEYIEDREEGCGCEEEGYLWVIE